MKTLVISILAAAPLACGLSAAQAQQPVDNYQSVALVAGHSARALPTLERNQRIDSSDECTLINLAVAYNRQGRSADARALYSRVLELENVQVDVANGAAMWSHDIARAGLRTTQLSAR
jgi:Flp pilus assembly protein TadD